MSALKRSDWRKRVCTHGNRVEHRLQIDAAYCNEPGCAARALSPITKAISDPSREAMREAADELNTLVDCAIRYCAEYVTPDSPMNDRSLANLMLGLFDGPKQRSAQARFRAALALDGDAK